jgi:hypothetical protein
MFRVPLDLGLLLLERDALVLLQGGDADVSVELLGIIGTA